MPRQTHECDAAMLRASEAQLRAVFEHSSVAIVQLSTETRRLLRVNAKFCELTGYSAEELTGMTPADLTFAEDRDADAKEHGRLLRKETALHATEKRYVRKDGTIIWVHVDASVLRDADGHPERTMAVVLDITARKKADTELREREGFIQRVAEVSPGVLYVFDLETQCTTFMSRSVASVIGYGAEELAAMGESRSPTCAAVVPRTSSSSTGSPVRRTWRSTVTGRGRDGPSSE